MAATKYPERIILPPDVIQLIKKVVELDGSQLTGKEDRPEFIRTKEVL